MVGFTVLGILFGILLGYFSRNLKISLISSKSQHDSFGCVLLQFHDPFFSLVETFDGGDIIADDGSSGLAIVYRCNGVVLFLAGSVLDRRWNTQMVSLTCCSLSSLTFF